VACFEHGSWLDEETALAMARAGAAFVPTLTVAVVMRKERVAWGLPELVMPRIEQVERRAEQAVKIAIAAGLTIGSGSDLLGPSQKSRGLELALRAAIDGPMGAIVAATATNAKILGIDGAWHGRGRQARDLVAVRGDPLAEPGLFADPERVILVVKGGVVEKDSRG